MLAARSAVLLLSAPLGALLGGPLVIAFGARGTLLLSALATVALALVAAALLWTHRYRPHMRLALATTGEVVRARREKRTSIGA